MVNKGKKHLTRLAMPKSWQIKRKGIKWIARPLPGSHPMKFGLPLVVIFRDLLNYAKTTKEVKNILNNQEILIDGIRRKESRFMVGLMDVISIPKTKTFIRILLSKKGKITFIHIPKEESNIKPCKIIGKTSIKGKIQLNLFDGKNVILDKDNYKLNDTVLVEMPSQKIKETFKFEKGSSVYLIGGKHVGEIGTIQDIKGHIIVYKRDNSTFETLKGYAFVVGKEKPVIKISQSENEINNKK